MAKSKWLGRSKETLLPLSVSQTFETALREWRCSGLIRITDEMDCELCGYKDLHYQYEILNPALGNSLWIGSTCIERFDIYLEDGNGREVKNGKAAYLNKLNRIQYIGDMLCKLNDTTPSGMIDVHRKIDLDKKTALEFLKTRKINPKQANYIFLRLDEEGISYNKEYFAIDDSAANRRMVNGFGQDQYIRIEAALPPRMRK